MSPTSASALRRGALAMGATLAAAAFVIGFHARVDGLGERQLTADEYYMVKSTEWLAETGLPGIPSGGYYTRGLLQQVASAGLLRAFGSTPWVHRLVPVGFGLLVIAAGFVYARRHASPELAVAIAAAMAVSSWEVEFSRFIRMYAALQFFTLAFLIALHRAWWEERGSRYLPHVFLVGAALSHQLSVCLVPLLFAPLLSPTARTRLRNLQEWSRYLIGSAIASAMAAAAVFLDLRNWGVSDRLPPGFSFPASSRFRLPPDPFLGDGSLLIAACALGLWALGFGAWRLRRRDGDWRLLHAGGFALSMAFHQLIPAAAFGAVLALRYGLLRPREQPRALLGLVALGLVCGAGWLGWALLDPSWVSSVSPGDLPRAFRLSFLSFPDYFFTLVVPWREDLPWLGAIGALALAQQLVRVARADVDRILTSPALLLLYVATFIALFDTKLVQTRYAFFVYPVLLTVIALSLRDLVRMLLGDGPRAGQTAACAFALLFVAADDFHPGHLLDPTSHEASYRLGPYAGFEDLWYHRHDFRSPAEFLNAAVDPARERVILVGRDPVEYALHREFAIFRPSPAGILEKSRERGTRDLWSDARMLSSRENVLRYTQGVQVVWLVDDADPGRRALAPDEIWGERFLSEETRFTSADGRIAVWRVALAAPLPASDPLR